MANTSVKMFKQRSRRSLLPVQSVLCTGFFIPWRELFAVRWGSRWALSELGWGEGCLFLE